MNAQNYKAGQKFTKETAKGFVEEITITEVYQSRISKTWNIRYSKKHDLGTYENSVKVDRFANVIDGYTEVKKEQPKKRWTEKAIKECTDIETLKQVMYKIDAYPPVTYQERNRRRERIEIIENRIKELSK